MNDDDFLRRAERAYFRTAGPYADIPSRHSGIAFASNTRPYVVLRGGRSSSGICAVYRIKTDDRLKRLKRWPAELG